MKVRILPALVVGLDHLGGSTTVRITHMNREEERLVLRAGLTEWFDIGVGSTVLALVPFEAGIQLNTVALLSESNVWRVSDFSLQVFLGEYMNMNIFDQHGNFTMHTQAFTQSGITMLRGEVRDGAPLPGVEQFSARLIIVEEELLLLSVNAAGQWVHYVPDSAHYEG